MRSENRRLFASDLGMMVNDIMVANFERIVDSDFTSKMEAQLDKIEEGELDWVDVIGNFYAIFVEELALAEQKIEKIKGRPACDEKGVPVECPICKAGMVERYSKNGKFFGCSRFPECKGTMPLDKRGRILRITKEDIECPLCGKELVVRMSRRGPFLGCGTFPGLPWHTLAGQRKESEATRGRSRICGPDLRQMRQAHAGAIFPRPPVHRLHWLP